MEGVKTAEGEGERTRIVEENVGEEVTK